MSAPHAMRSCAIFWAAVALVLVCLLLGLVEWVSAVLQGWGWF